VAIPSSCNHPRISTKNIIIKTINLKLFLVPFPFPFPFPLTIVLFIFIYLCKIFSNLFLLFHVLLGGKRVSLQKATTLDNVYRTRFVKVKVGAKDSDPLHPPPL